MSKPKPIEDTYVAELLSVIKEIGNPVGFDAEFNMKSPSGKTDITLYYRGKDVAVIEVKLPNIDLSDPDLNEQALKYAEWYHKNQGVNYYATHNLRYLKLFRYIGEKARKKKPLKSAGAKEADWVPASDFPFTIMPWVKDISEFKQISTNRQAKGNLENFLLRFRELLEGKTLDLTKDVIETIRKYIEEGASAGLGTFYELYKYNKWDIAGLFQQWRLERGIDKPKNDFELRGFLSLMIKEQLYTFSMKILFYLVLQNISTEMSSKLKENLGSLKPSDPEYFKRMFEELFKLAIEKSGDFEEVFGSDTVDRLPMVEHVLQPMTNLISYLNQIKWNEINVDIIGRIFENLIYSERRHLLGQHYTDTMVVDLIVTGTLRSADKLIDPACGSGTFLVRALNYWRTKRLGGTENLTLVEGIDIDKLASMLSKINLYIQSMEEFKEGVKYYPKIQNHDFFQVPFAHDYSYVIANPPYTRQEEMKMAFLVKDYKKYLVQVVSDIPDWSRKASIYAYFLVGGGKLLREKGRLGFIVENSWLNAEYGMPLINWFLDNFTVEYVIESLKERWFEDAAIITDIVIAEKSVHDDCTTKFVYLKKKLKELFGSPPPAGDLAANERYYENISDMLSSVREVSSEYLIDENDNVRFVSLKKGLLRRIVEKFGTCGILKGPRKYLEILFKLLEEKQNGLAMLGDVLELERGITTNANEIFYLPSKHWKYRDETDSYLDMVGPSHKVVRISKRFLAPLIRPDHIKDSRYEISKLSEKRHEDYCLWVEDVSKVDDDGTKEYLKWATSFIGEENKVDGSRFPTIVNRVDSPTWTRLPAKSGAAFLLKNNPHRNFAIYSNRILNPQVDKRYFLGMPKGKPNEKIVFAVLNSVFTYLGMELIGRSNLGEGVLDVNVTDYARIPIIDPVMVEERLKSEGKLKDLLLLVDEMLKLKPVNIESEARNNIRLKMEEHVLGAIGLKKTTILEFYDELESLVDMRTERAASVKETKKR